MSHSRVLSRSECVERLAGGQVGRVAVCTPRGPRVVPVNYGLDEDSIVFRTTPFSVVGTHGWDRRLAFEVDHVEPEEERGWSVVATGLGVLVEDDSELENIRRSGDPTPWADGERMLYIRLRWDDLTGREIASRARTVQDSGGVIEDDGRKA